MSKALRRPTEADESRKSIAQQLRDEINKRKNHPAVAMSGLGNVLVLLDAYLAESEERFALLEVVTDDITDALENGNVKTT